MIEEITITSLKGRGSITMKTGDHLGYWLGPVDWGQAEGQHQTYSYYNQIGESIVSTSLLSRPVSITGWVMDGGEDTLQARCDTLNSFFSPAEDYRLEYKDRKINFRPDQSVKYSREVKKNNRLIRQFLLQGTAPYPLFTGLQDTAVPFDITGKLFRFPTNFGQEAPLIFGTVQRNYNTSINNTGGFSTGIVASFKFTGDVTNPRVKNLTTGKLIGVNRTFGKGERLEISTVLGSKHITLYKDDGTSENLIKYRDFRTAWIQLEPESNILALDCDDLDQRGNMDVAIFFTPLYLEVE